MELITIGSWPALRGGPSTIFGILQHLKFVPVLFTVYLLHELKVPDKNAVGQEICTGAF